MPGCICGILTRLTIFDYVGAKTQVLHPSVDPLVPLFQPVTPPEERSNIVVMGRIFSGRQSKGHLHAIRMMSQLVTKLPIKECNITLLLVGYLQPGYVRRSISSLLLRSHHHFLP